MTGIQLGLSRISRLVQIPRNSWKAVHVAGTNGKGSVCNHTYNMLLASGIKCGMFTSPHLIDRWDSVSINGLPLSKEAFEGIEKSVKVQDEKLGLRATPFEILTATAFEAFTNAFKESELEVAVIETGVGGLEDATNIIPRPTPAVITKIGFDHEDVLGEGLQNIVNHKAGIMKTNAPCIVDGSNSIDIRMMLEEKARIRNVKPFKICYAAAYGRKEIFTEIPGWDKLSDHKRMHLVLAYEAAQRAIRALKKEQPDWKTILPLVSDFTFPGRQESISIRSLTGRVPHVLLDGCHNKQSAQELNREVAKRYREVEQIKRVCWVFAASKSKDLHGIFWRFVKEGDDVVTTEFGPVDGMPWISPASAEDIIDTIQGKQPRTCTATKNVLEALRKATELAGSDPIVIAGSLYLVSDVLRLLRDHEVASKMSQRTSEYPSNSSPERSHLSRVH